VKVRKRTSWSTHSILDPRLPSLRRKSLVFLGENNVGKTPIALIVSFAIETPVAESQTPSGKVADDVLTHMQVPGWRPGGFDLKWLGKLESME